MYQCPLTLRDEHELQVIEKEEGHREVFGPKKGDLRGSFRILHNEELCGLYGS
jgi:hypothetical protein